MKHTGLGILLCLSIVLLGCNSNKVVQTSGQPIIHLSKGACFGRCAVYEFSIFEHRQMMVYNGIKNTQLSGVHYLRMSKADFSDLIDFFDNNQFNQLDSTYFSGAKDLQRIVLTYKNKQVKFHLRAVPDQLRMIYNKVEHIATTAEWIEGVQDAPTPKM